MEKETSAAEKELQIIANKVGMKMPEIFKLVNTVYIELDNFEKRLIQLRNNAANQKQLDLVEVKLRNEGIKEILLVAKLERVLWRLRTWEKIKSVFTKKKKADEPAA